MQRQGDPEPGAELGHHHQVREHAAERSCCGQPVTTGQRRAHDRRGGEVGEHRPAVVEPVVGMRDPIEGQVAHHAGGQRPAGGAGKAGGKGAGEGVRGGDHQRSDPFTQQIGGTGTTLRLVAAARYGDDY